MTSGNELVEYRKHRIYRQEELVLKAFGNNELGLEVKNGHVIKLTYTFNNQESIPTNIGDLQHLIVLTLQGFQISTIPPSLGTITTLKELSLVNINLTEIPEELGNLVNLEKLNLENNNLYFFPPVIRKLPDLKILNLNNNHIPKIPITLLKKMTRIIFEDRSLIMEEVHQDKSKFKLTTFPNLSVVKQIFHYGFRKGVISYEKPRSFISLIIMLKKIYEPDELISIINELDKDGINIFMEYLLKDFDKSNSRLNLVKYFEAIFKKSASQFVEYVINSLIDKNGVFIFPRIEILCAIKELNNQKKRDSYFNK